MRIMASISTGSSRRGLVSSFSQSQVGPPPPTRGISSIRLTRPRSQRTYSAGARERDELAEGSTSLHMCEEKSDIDLLAVI